MTRPEGLTTDAKVEAYNACNHVFHGLLKEMRGHCQLIIA